MFCFVCLIIIIIVVDYKYLRSAPQYHQSELFQRVSLGKDVDDQNNNSYYWWCTTTSHTRAAGRRDDNDGDGENVDDRYYGCWW